MHIGKYPYTFYVLFFIVGIFLYPYNFFSWKVGLVILVLLILFLIMLFKSLHFRVLFSILVLLFWCILGQVVVGINEDKAPNHYSNFLEKGKSQYVSVVLDEQNNSNEKNKKYSAEVHSISYKDKLVRTSGKILLLFNKAKTDSILLLGNEYGLLIKIQDPPAALNPYQFDYKKYLQRNYISNIGVTQQIIYQKSHTSLWYKIKNVNQFLCAKIDSSSLNFDSKEFLKAYLLGDRSDMKKDNIQAYSKAGIMHLIAISGMHVALLFGMIFSALSLLFGSGNRRMIIIVSLIFVWLFGCFVGLSSSVSRACLMITIYYVFELLKRSSNIYHSLSLSAILILLYNPYEIYSIGFQLSYVAVFVMSWLNPVCLKYFKTKNKLVNKWIIEPLSISIIAQLGTMPFVLYYFHQFSLLSIPINILIIPYTYIITYASIIELFVIYLPVDLQEYFTYFYDFWIQLLVRTTHWVSSSEIGLFENVSFNWLELSALFLAIVLFKFFLITPKSKNIYPVLICLVTFQLNRLVKEYKYSEKENFIVFHPNKYPVLGFRKGKTLVILKDENEDLEKINRYIVKPYITGEGITKISYQDINYRGLYRWKNEKIQILNQENTFIFDTTTYLVSSTIDLDSYEANSIKKIIKTGNEYYNLKEEKELVNTEIIWDTKNYGAFIAP